jgi:phenylpropionate dioxygenase-like ring-hydroxylating dioxygenase large terminal subunit
MMDGFPTEAWYMAGWSHEVGEALLRRRLLGRAILLYRLADGSVTALDDRCPHRFAPLSRGTRNGDEVTCAYHGLTFDGSGACVRNPFGPVPKGATIRHWPVKEQDGIVWLWPGDPGRAAEAPLPDFSILHRDQPAPPISGLMPMAANYQYGTDNLMDLSHIEFVHRGSFAGRGVIFAGKHEVRQEGDFLHSNWWMPDVPAPAHTYGIYPAEMRTDHWLDMQWQAPATMLLEIGATPKGGERTQGVIVHQAHILTPESADSSHYFWATTRSGGPVTEEGDEMLRGLMIQAFVDEDKPIIEAAYSNLDGEDFWAARPVFLGVDAGGTRARRLLQTMISRHNHEGMQI